MPTTALPVNLLNDWNKLEQEIGQLLQTKGHLVGVKMFKRNDELPAKAERPTSQLDPCQIFQMARFHTKTTYAEKTGLFCARGASALGLEPVPKDIIHGVRDETGKAPDVQAAKRLQANIPRLPLEAGYKGFCMFPLSDAPFDPDLVVMAGTPAQMLRMNQAYAYFKRGKRLTFQTSGTQALCADCIATVTLTGKPNMTTPCYGARYFAYFEDSEMLYALPAKDLEGLIEALMDTHEGGYPYPILHEFEVTPGGPASLTISREVPSEAKHGKEITHVKKTRKAK